MCKEFSSGKTGEMWYKRVSKEEQRLADFKKDVAVQSQQLAKERNDLLERCGPSASHGIEKM